MRWSCTTRRKKRAETHSAFAELSAPDFPDHFSGHASEYATFRPQYPEALYEFLADHCQQNDAAWDCATGNGQAALSLARHFKKIFATDASTEQIASAEPNQQISYSIAPAESSGIEDASVDLVTIAQALHWFDIDAFFAEVTRVLKQGGLLAAWSYEASSVSDEVDLVFAAIFDEVEDYWPPQREIVMNNYRDIVFPWPELEVPAVAMTESWVVEQMLGYLRTWSATRRYQNHRGNDPIARHEKALRRAWGSGARIVSWPLNFKVARQK